MEEILNQIKLISKPVEANICGCFFDYPELFLDYNTTLRQSEFLNGIWKYYFTVLKKVAGNNLKIITEADILLYLEKEEKLKQLWVDYGEYKTLESMSGLFKKENIDYYISELKKWSAFSKIVNVFKVEDSLVEKVKTLDINQLYDFYNAQINNLFIDVYEDVTTSRLDENLDEIIEEADKGMKRGLPIPSPILSRTINGINQGQIMLIGGQSGSGKTTFLIQMILSSVFEQEEAGVIFLNEQDNVKIKTEMLTWIINNKILKPSDKPFNKIRWRDGKFTEEEKKLLLAASKILKEKMKNNKIILVEFKTYTHKTVVRSIKKYASMGVKVFAIDTFKMSSDADSSQPFWLAMQNQMKELDDLVKPSNLNVSLICTIQLGKGAIVNRYLSANDLGMSKNIIDVCSVCLLIRKMHSDEYEGGKNVISVLKPIQGTSSGVEVKPDPKKRHSIIFNVKNRNGESEHEQIVSMHELGTMRYEEIGVTQINFGT